MIDIFMKSIYLLSFCVFSCLFAYTQTAYYGTVVDGTTGEPLEFADIHNNENYSTTNENGEFYISTSLDSINISLLGYYPQNILCKNLKDINDSIFLEKRFIELDEIVVTNENTTFKSMVKSIESNFPSFPYKENYFLRSVLKKNGTIVKIEDIVGIIERQKLFSTSENPMPKKNYSVEVQNMRKAGIIEGRIDFELFSFEKLLNSYVALYMSPKIYSFKEVYSKDSSYIKLYFSPKSIQETTTRGYYIINKDDNAFNQVSLVNKSPDAEYTERGKVKYRTIHYGLTIDFKKSMTKNVYHIDKARLDAKVEVIDEKSKNDTLFEVSYIMHTKNSFEVMDFKENTSIKKDIFDLTFKYNSSYWENQDQLLLTQEMKDFLSNLDPKTNEYKITSNL